MSAATAALQDALRASLETERDFYAGTRAQAEEKLMRAVQDNPQLWELAANYRYYSVREAVARDRLERMGW